MNNLQQMTKSMPSLMQIDKNSEDFFNLLNEKSIEPKSLEDLSRIIIFFDETLDKTIKAIKEDKSLPEIVKDTVIARFTIDMFGKISEDYGLEFMLVPSFLGKHNQERFQKAQKNLV